MRNKVKKLKSPSLSSHLYPRLDSLIPDSSTSSSPELPREMGNGGCDKSLTLGFCVSFLHTSSPVAACGLSMSHSCFGAHPPAPAGVIHGCSVDVCLLQQSPLQGLQKNLCSMPGTSPHLLLFTFVLEGLFLRLFVLIPHSCAVLYIVLSYPCFY